MNKDSVLVAEYFRLLEIISSNWQTMNVEEYKPLRERLTTLEGILHSKGHPLNKYSRIIEFQKVHPEINIENLTDDAKLWLGEILFSDLKEEVLI